MAARRNPTGIYGIRVLGTPARTSPEDHYAETVNFDFHADSRDTAITRYNEVRAATFRQQVTLYSPSGRRIREARGTARQIA